jgi:hypothetical protein
MPLARHLRALGRLGDAEVEHPRDPVDPDHDVLRADVAVDQIERLALLVARFVRRLQPPERPRERRRRDSRGQPPARTGAREPRQRLAVHVFHREQEFAVLLDHVDDGHDVRVTHPRHQPRLVEQHRHQLGIVAVRAVQPLDGHRSREPGRPPRAPQMHARHAPPSDLVKEIEARRAG